MPTYARLCKTMAKAWLAYGLLTPSPWPWYGAGMPWPMPAPMASQRQKINFLQ